MSYHFESEIPMDKEHSLDQMTARFQSVQDGLPEIVKNAKDHYSRLHITDPGTRHIVVFASTAKQTVGVLDFGGAKAAHFEGWKVWSDRAASGSTADNDIEGGHGNGGKAFMVRGSTLTSYLESVSGGRRTNIGFDNKTRSRKYIPGTAIEQGNDVRDLPCQQPEERLTKVLIDVGASIEQLPSAARRAFQSRSAYTLVVVRGVREWSGRRPATIKKLAANIAGELAAHGQAQRTIETCAVWVVIDGRVPAEPLSVALPEPMSGFEDISSAELPSRLLDPITRDEVEIDQRNGPGALELATSRLQLRMTDSRKATNVIRIENGRNVVAYWSVGDLVPAAHSGFIYGRLVAPCLTDEHLAGSDRTSLADTDVVRAIRHWVERQVYQLSERIRAARASQAPEDDRRKAAGTLQELRDLMRQYLEASSDDTSAGTQEGGEHGTGDGKESGRKGVKFGARVDVITVEDGRADLSLATGTTVPIMIRAFETQEDGTQIPVRDFAKELVGGNYFLTLESDSQLSAREQGIARVRILCPVTGVSSDEIAVESLPCSDVDLVGPDRELKRGERIGLLYSFHTIEGYRDDFVIDAWVEPPGAAKVGRRGYFSAGDLSCEALVRVRFGPGSSDIRNLPVVIGDEIFQRKGTGGQQGDDIPRILLCGEEAPGMEDFPPSERTHSGGEDFPTIIEDPVFFNVVWINPFSKESLKVREGRGGSAGIGKVTSKSFYEYLALKCFEILKRLKVRQELGDNRVTEREFVQQLATAEMDCSGFIEAGFMLAERLATDRGGSETG